MIYSNKAIGFAMVKNEQDIIESFVRHNMIFLDLLVVVDNNSSDSTLIILNELKREGYNILLWQDETLSHEQSRITTSAYQKISKDYEFDLFIPLDADEFIILDDKNEIAYTPGNVYNIDRYDYVSTTEEMNDDVVSSMSRQFEHKNWNKVFIAHKKDDDVMSMVIKQGNHSVLNKKTGKDIPTTNSNLILAHFPYRGINHYLSKIILGSQAMIALDYNYLDENHKKVMATHWKKEYFFIKSKHCSVSFNDYLKRIYQAEDIAHLDKMTIPAKNIISCDSKYKHLQKDALLYSLVRNYESLAIKFWRFNYLFYKFRKVKLIKTKLLSLFN